MHRDKVLTWFVCMFLVALTVLLAYAIELGFMQEMNSRSRVRLLQEHYENLMRQQEDNCACGCGCDSELPYPSE